MICRAHSLTLLTHNAGTSTRFTNTLTRPVTVSVPNTQNYLLYFGCVIVLFPAVARVQLDTLAPPQVCKIYVAALCAPKAP